MIFSFSYISLHWELKQTLTNFGLFFTYRYFSLESNGFTTAKTTVRNSSRISLQNLTPFVNASKKQAVTYVIVN